MKKKYKLDEYESELLAAFENDEFVVVDNNEEYKAMFKQAADNYFLTQHINMRISKNDLMTIKRMAANEGMAYQPFIRSILHKYAMGYYKQNV